MSKKQTTKTHQLNFRIDSEIVKALDKHVDGFTYRSRAHLISVILAEWNNKKLLSSFGIKEKDSK